MYGLTESQRHVIENILARYPKISKAVLYGSRARGDHRTGSDIDLVLFGEDLKGSLYLIHDELEEALPYFIDLTLFDAVRDKALKARIDTEGVLIYRKTST